MFKKRIFKFHGNFWTKFQHFPALQHHLKIQDYCLKWCFPILDSMSSLKNLAVNIRLSPPPHTHTHTHTHTRSFCPIFLNVIFFIMDYCWHYYSTIVRICEKTLGNVFIIPLEI